MILHLISTIGRVILQQSSAGLCAIRVEAKTFSPLAELLTEHVSPERLYLETLF